MYCFALALATEKLIDRSHVSHLPQLRLIVLRPQHEFATLRRNMSSEKIAKKDTMLCQAISMASMMGIVSLLRPRQSKVVDLTLYVGAKLRLPLSGGGQKNPTHYIILIKGGLTNQSA